MYVYDSELYHYGRLGMKWGQHIFSNAQARRTVRKRKAAAQKAKETREKNKRAAAERAGLIEKGKIPVSKMTDAEIKARIERLNLEKTYRDAIKDKRADTAGHRFVDKFLNTTIDKVAENAFADVISQAVKTGLVKGVNSALKSEEVFTNNKKK